MKKVIRMAMMAALLLLSSLSFLPSTYSDGADENSKTNENSQAAEKSKADQESTWEQFKDMIKRSSYDTFVLPFEFLWDAVRGFPEDPGYKIIESSPPPENPPHGGNPPSGRSSGPYVPPSSSYGLPNAYSIEKAGLGSHPTGGRVVHDLSGDIKNEMSGQGLGDQKDKTAFDALDVLRGGVDRVTGNQNPGVDTRSIQSSHMSTSTSTSSAESRHDHDALGKERY